MDDEEIFSSLAALIERGAIQTPTALYAKFDGYEFVATLQPDGSLIVGDQCFGSLSIAAGILVTAKTGKRTPGRRYYSCNGWLFWHIATADGQQRSLAEIRQQALTAEI